MISYYYGSAYINKSARWHKFGMRFGAVLRSTLIFSAPNSEESQDFRRERGENKRFGTKLQIADYWYVFDFQLEWMSK